MRDALINDLLAAVDHYRCINRRLHHSEQLSASDMLVFGAVLRARAHRQPPPRMSDIATQAGLSTAAISQIAGQLEKKGLVERYSLPEDRRTVYVRITEQGEKVFAQEIEDAKQRVAAAMAQMGEERSEQFLQLTREFQQIIMDM